MDLIALAMRSPDKNLCKSLSGDRSAEHCSASLQVNSLGTMLRAPQF